MAPNKLQLWLSPRPRHRETTAHKASVYTPDEAIRYSFIKNKAGLRAVRERHDVHNMRVRDRKSGPPLHIHLRQDETFEVQQGALGVVVNGRKHFVTRYGGPITVPRGARYVEPT